MRSTQSHPLSRGYRAVLPTSLGDVLFSLEVACFGDLMRSSVRRPVCRAGPLPGAPGAAPACVASPCGGRRWAERRALPHRRAPQGGSRVRPRAPGAGGPRVPSPLRPGLPGSGPASLSRRGRGEALRAESPAGGRGILLLFSGRVPSCYSNQDLDYRVLHAHSRAGFDAPGTASYLLPERSSGV